MTKTPVGPQARDRRRRDRETSDRRSCRRKDKGDDQRDHEGNGRGRFVALALLLAASMLVVIPTAPPAAEAAPPDGPDKLADFERRSACRLVHVHRWQFGGDLDEIVADTDVLALPGQAATTRSWSTTSTSSTSAGSARSTKAPPARKTGAKRKASASGSTEPGRVAYQAEISDNRSDPNGDTSERFDYMFTDSTSGWQLISIP